MGYSYYAVANTAVANAPVMWFGLCDSNAISLQTSNAGLHTTSFDFTSTYSNSSTWTGNISDYYYSSTSNSISLSEPLFYELLNGSNTSTTNITVTHGSTTDLISFPGSVYTISNTNVSNSGTTTGIDPFVFANAGTYTFNLSYGLPFSPVSFNIVVT